jgi:hypothetical protein
MGSGTSRCSNLLALPDALDASTRWMLSRCCRGSRQRSGGRSRLIHDGGQGLMGRSRTGSRSPMVPRGALPWRRASRQPQGRRPTQEDPSKPGRRGAVIGSQSIVKTGSKAGGGRCRYGDVPQTADTWTSPKRGSRRVLTRTATRAPSIDCPQINRGRERSNRRCNAYEQSDFLRQ